jgi:hypothetical protein
VAAYDSESTIQPGQWPATDAFTLMGLPAQDESTGAGGSTAPESGLDDGHTEQPGQYPASMPIVGTPLGGTGAPGTAGIPPQSQHNGPDSVTFSPFTQGYKPSRDEQEGQDTQTYTAPVSGTSDWTQANGQSYGGADQFFLPGIAGNMPQPGSGRFTTGAGTVRVGGNVNGQRG